GSVIQTKLSGYVAGEDGKAGMKGRLVSKTGAMIARTMVAGFLSGMSQAFDYDPVEVLSTTASNNVQYQQRWSSDAAKGGLAQGLTRSLDRVAEYYMNLADQMTPAVEVSAGRQVDLIVISGTYLDVLGGTKNGELANTNTMKPTQVSQRTTR
ncbi:MAG: TraB/VirB10 family protein, partial [Sutterella sp.]